MIIKGKKIRSIEKYFKYITNGTEIIIGINSSLVEDNLHKKIGFNIPLVVGQKVLPSRVFGKISRFNAEGKNIKKINLPMETVYHPRWWKWKQWAGRNQTVDRHRIVDVPYKRYPRVFIEPPSVELSVINVAEKIYISADSITFNDNNRQQIMHIANLFLEIFGECEILVKDKNIIIPSSFMRLNWEILPPGERPWPELKRLLEPITQGLKKEKRKIYEDRFSFISNFNPIFTAVGRAGFKGYIIFGFKDINLYICESIFYGNAIYVFEEKWEELSQMTKAEILNENLQKMRIIHNENWEIDVRKILRRNK